MERLSEQDGVAVLTEVFRAHGYAIAHDVPFDEGGVAFNVDGWDAAARVGFEYRTHESDDKRDLTDDEIGALGARIERGELLLLIVDDVRLPDAAALRELAERFLATAKTLTPTPSPKSPKGSGARATGTTTSKKKTASTKAPKKKTATKKAQAKRGGR